MGYDSELAALQEAFISLASDMLSSGSGSCPSKLLALSFLSLALSLSLSLSVALAVLFLSGGGSAWRFRNTADAPQP